MASRGSKRKSGAAPEVEEISHDSRDSGDKRRRKGLPEEQTKNTRKRTISSTEGATSKPREPERYFPIAIVGIGMRLPEAITTDEFEKVLEDEREVIKEIPADRWDINKYHHYNIDNLGTHVNKKAAFIDNFNDFDHTFYNVSPREASNMNPEQRHLLEATQEALDDAGIPSEKLEKNTGVFIGVCNMDHGLNLIEDAKCMNPYTHTGVAHSITANRVSYAYDLRGPSIAYDNSEASSLTALHYACYSLWNSECPTCIVAGVNQLVVPEVMVAYSKMGVLSPDDCTRPFSAEANGHVRGEGVGVVLIKPLHEAIKNGDHVYCTIRASTLAFSGAATELTAHDMDAQCDLLRRTYDMFGLSPDQVDFVETNAGGHPVEDAKEVKAIAKVFTDEGQRRQKPLLIGSAKGNFGHQEGNSGLIQIIKAVMMLKNRKIYPNINLGQVHPEIHLEDWNLEIPRSLDQFRERKNFTVAASNFGGTGALSHVVLEEYKQRGKQHKKGGAGWTFGASSKKGLKIPIPLSAKSTNALKATCKNWQEFESEADAQEVVSWLAMRRSHYSCRIVVLADSGEDFRNKMQMYQDGVINDEIIEGTVPAHNEEKNICFIYPGQGQQHYEMGRSLYKYEPIFRKTVDECDAIYMKLSGKSILKDYRVFVELEEGEKLDKDAINSITISQPAILFLQIGLDRLFQHWGITANVCVGHSLGEMASGFSSNALSVKDAIILQYYRAVQQERLSGTGLMAAWRADVKQGEELCSKYDDLYIACVNAPGSITVAGNIPLIKQLCAENPKSGKALAVKAAFHTPHMDPVGDDFKSSVRGRLTNGKPHGKTQWYSTVTGERYEGEGSAEYYWDNIRNRVEFVNAVSAVLKDFSNTVFIELGGSATLLGCVRGICKQDGIAASGLIPTGQRKADDRVSTLKALATLHTMGVPLNWANITNDCGQWMNLPKYGWQHQSFLYQSESTFVRKRDLFVRTISELKGAMDMKHLQHLRDYVVDDKIVYPRAGFVEYLAEKYYGEEELPSLTNVEFSEDLLEVTEPPKQLTIDNKPIPTGTKVNVMCEGKRYVKAVVQPVTQQQPPNQNLEVIKQRAEDTLDASEFYARLEDMGVKIKDTWRFKLVEEAFISDGESLAILSPPSQKWDRVYTTVLENAFSLVSLTKPSNGERLNTVKIDSIQMFVPKLPMKEKLAVYTQLISATSSTVRSDIFITDSFGAVLVEIKGYEAKSSTATTEGIYVGDCVYNKQWKSVAKQPMLKKKAEPWVVVHDGSKEIVSAIKSKISSDAKDMNAQKFMSTMSSNNPSLNVVYIWNESDQQLKELARMTNVACEGDMKMWVITKGGCYMSENQNAVAATGYVQAMSKNSSLRLLDLPRKVSSTSLDLMAAVLTDASVKSNVIAIRDNMVATPQNTKLRLNNVQPTGKEGWILKTTSLNKTYLYESKIFAKEIERPSADQVKVKVLAATVNPLLTKSGGEEVQLAQECCGLVESVGASVTGVKPSDQVIAFTPGDINSHVILPADKVYKKPKNITMAEASSACLPYAAAYRALHKQARVQQGETVLVHFTSEAMGYAVVQFSHYLGAKTYCVVDDPVKQAFLKNLPGVSGVTTPDKYFEDIMKWTEDNGVDAVVSLGDSKVPSDILRTLDFGGRLCLFGELDNLENVCIPVDTLDRNISLHSLNMQIFMEDTKVFSESVKTVLNLMQNGSLPTITFTSNPVDKYHHAIDRALDKENIGAVVLEVPSQYKPFSTEPNVQAFRSDVTYLLTGMDSDVAQEFARWMTLNGAKHLAFVATEWLSSWNSKNTINTIEQTHGGKVYQFQADLTKEDEVYKLLKTISRNGMPPLKGIFHLEGGLLSQKHSKPVKSTQSAKLLDKVSSEMRLSLDHFLMLSLADSARCPETALSCASCAQLDTLAQQRRDRSLPALSVQTGWFHGAGLLGDKSAVKPSSATRGLHLQEVLKFLGSIINRPKLPAVVTIENKSS